MKRAARAAEKNSRYSDGFPIADNIAGTRFRGRFGSSFGFRGHDRPWKQPVHATGESSADAFTFAGAGDFRQVLRFRERSSERQEAEKKTDGVHSRSARLSGEKVSLPEVSERGGPKRRRRRSVAVRDPSEDMVSEQKDQMEAAESAAAGAASPPSDGGEGATGARRGTSPWEHRRLLSTVQCPNSNTGSSASAAAAACAVHRLHGCFSLHRSRSLSKRHLRPRMSALTRPNIAVPGSFPLSVDRRQPFPPRRISVFDDEAQRVDSVS